MRVFTGSHSALGTRGAWKFRGQLSSQQKLSQRLRPPARAIRVLGTVRLVRGQLREEGVHMAMISAKRSRPAAFLSFCASLAALCLASDFALFGSPFLMFGLGILCRFPLAALLAWLV
ncbi:hypothetical protein FA13DRAFT_1412634 [Coprinellus micaceus]|uniref:Uncharacterized protein n=1 Tax=Coprinellus micaceus TaxID=71717 RepID=A0A4Y7SNT7_COPMI|nr:hypothetical protein FA13DRAFT_1412634 [Coprinellus micaceus]